MNWKAVLVYLWLVGWAMLAAMTAVLIFSAVKAEAMPGDKPMPPVIALFLCKSEPDGTTDDNDKMTQHRSTKWVYEDSKMQCRRQEVPLYDPVAGMKLNPNDSPVPEMTMNMAACQRASVMIAAQWEIQHPTSNYQVWRTACPVPIVDLRTGRIIDWKLPECSHYDTVVCEVDTAI